MVFDIPLGIGEGFNGGLLFFFSFFLLKSVDAQAQLAIAVEKERSASEELMSFKSQLASLESQNSLFRQEKARLLSQLEAEKNKRERLEDECCRYHIISFFIKPSFIHINLNL